MAGDALAQTRAELESLGGEVATVVCNVTREEYCARLADTAIERFGQINYSSSKAALSVMPKVITAEFFKHGISQRIRCVAIAPGYVAIPMVNVLASGFVTDLHHVEHYRGSHGQGTHPRETGR